MFMQVGNSINLKYANGQYSFRNYSPGATDAQKYELAQLLNAFQDTPITAVEETEVFDLMF